jgi:hypothetical protein
MKYDVIDIHVQVDVCEEVYMTGTSRMIPRI